jgi:hypothetical protein
MPFTIVNLYDRMPLYRVLIQFCCYRPVGMGQFTVAWNYIQEEEGGSCISGSTPALSSISTFVKK